MGRLRSVVAAVDELPLPLFTPPERYNREVTSELTKSLRVGGHSGRKERLETLS